MKIHQLPVVAAVSITISLLATSEVGAYTFTKIVDNNSSFFSFDYPAINDSGTVAILGFLKDGSSGIFTGSGGAITTIADTSGPFNSFRALPDINNVGTVVFGAKLDSGGEGVFTSSGRGVTTIADTNSLFSYFGTDGFTYNFSAINDSGTVAFLGTLKDGSSGIFTSSSGKLTTIVDTSSSFSYLGHPLFYLQNPSINDRGAVAFGATAFGANNGYNRSILVSTGGVITTIVDDTSIIKFSESAVINNKGTVALQADPNNFDYFTFLINGIFTVSEEKITIIASANGKDSPFNRGFSSPAINDEDTVVFTASVKGASFTSEGIFTGADSIVSKVIVTGDTLFGSTVIGVRSWDKAVNNLGQIAFYAELADGTRGIYRADPENISPSKSVPEPTSVFGLLVGALGLVQRLKYKKRCKKAA